MELKKILAISGKPGLFQMVAQTKNGIVVESLLDGKRFTAFAHERISSLEEISIYTEDDDIALREVFLSIKKKENGEKAIDPNSSAAELESYFEEIVPDFDKERVYKSDIKKLIKWYNLLAEKDMLDFEEEEEEETAETDSKKTDDKEKPDADPDKNEEKEEKSK